VLTEVALVAAGRVRIAATLGECPRLADERARLRHPAKPWGRAALYRRGMRKVANMWSPQLYIRRGKNLGLPELGLRVVAAKIARLANGPYRLPALLSLAHLSRRCGVSYKDLRRYVERHGNWPYRSFNIRKRSGGLRRILVPEPALMRVQRWIAYHILRCVPAHDRSYAFSLGSSIFKCAEQHCGARWLVKMDIADFFGSTTEIQVFRAFVALGYGRLVALELARICTYRPTKSLRYRHASWRAWPREGGVKAYEQEFLGRLPQGAPSSPMLANLTMQSIDSALTAYGKAHGLTYTRYSDDLCFSTSGEFDRGRARALVGEVTRVLASQGLELNRRKTRVVPPRARKVVLGLLVDGAAPRLSREFRDRMRQHLYYLKKFGARNHMQRRQFESVGGMYRHIRGLVDYANAIDVTYASQLHGALAGVNWHAA
jgi:RNA-directed DNA polymerase